MSEKQAYPIGTPGTKWAEQERAEWLSRQSVKRSYQEEVVAKLMPLRQDFELIQYGALSYDAERYPLFAVKTPAWDSTSPVSW